MLLRCGSRWLNNQQPGCGNNYREGDLPNALAWDSIDSLKWDYDLSPAQEDSVIDPELIDRLRDLSLKRQQALDEFSYLQESIDWFRSNAAKFVKRVIGK